MVERQPGETPQPASKESVNLAASAGQTVDDTLDDLVGFRPARDFARVGETLAPANVIRNVTGVPKPSEVIDDFADDVERRIEQLGEGR